MILPSGQLVAPTVLEEIGHLLDMQEQLHQLLADPDARAVLGEHMAVEEMDPQEDEDD